jgi:hypothetical protein
MLRAQVDGVLRNLLTTVVIERRSRAWVDVAAREVAAQDVHTNPVATLKHQRRRIHLDGELIQLSGLQEFGLSGTVAITSAHDAIGNIQIHAVWKVGVGRVHVERSLFEKVYGGMALAGTDRE